MYIFNVCEKMNKIKKSQFVDRLLSDPGGGKYGKTDNTLLPSVSSNKTHHRHIATHENHPLRIKNYSTHMLLKYVHTFNSSQA